MNHSPSALSAAALAVIAALGLPLPRTAVAQSTTPTFVQGAAFSTAPISATTVTLTSPVGQGDLLVGWFSQYNAPGQVQVSDNVNGTWTRVPGSLTFISDTGDIALYYREDSQAAPDGMTITISASSSAYLQGTVADYSGVALAGALDQIVSARGVGTVVDTGATVPVDAGELVFAALVTGGSPSSVTPGSSVGIPYTPRAETSDGFSYEEDIMSSAAGAQDGTATLASATDWYAVCAVFHPAPATPQEPPSTPTGLEATSVASTRVALAWSPSTGSVAGYTVYRDGSAIGTARPDTTIFLDPEVTPSTAYTYSVDAFDLANDHSASSVPLTVTTPAQSPEFIQGAATSTADRVESDMLTLTEPVAAGDLLLGWFSQFDALGEVQVSDNVNGPWTRSVSTTFSGAGDIALYYRENSAAAPSGLAITVSASAPAYLQAAAADYRDVATAGALDQAVVSDGQGTYASAGPTASVPAGELVVAAVITGGQPASAVPGSSQMVPYVLDLRYGSASSLLEDILSSAEGPQEGSSTLGTATNWFMVLATFRPASTTTTTQSATTTTTSDPPTTTTTTTTIDPPTTTTTATTMQPPTTTTTDSPTTSTSSTTTTSTSTTTTQAPTTTMPTATTTTEAPTTTSTSTTSTSTTTSQAPTTTMPTATTTTEAPTTTSTSTTTSQAPTTTMPTATTTTEAPTTTTTTLPCTSARCIVGAAQRSAACAGQTIPLSVTAKFTEAENLIDRAATSPADKVRKLLKRAKTTLKQAKAKATRAATGKKPKLSAGCAAVLKGAADHVATGLGV